MNHMRQGKIVVSRLDSSVKEMNGQIIIEVRDENLSKVVEVICKPEDFAAAITGRFSDCVVVTEA